MRQISVAIMLILAGAVVHAETVTGTVRNQAGEPLAGAMVQMRFDDKTTTSDTNGYYTIETTDSVHPFCFFWGVSADGELIGYTGLRFTEGNPTIPPLSLVLSPARLLSGRVVDERGEPVEGATVAGVSQTTLPGSTTTDSLGEFRLAVPSDRIYPVDQICAFKSEVGFDYHCIPQNISSPAGEGETTELFAGPFELTLHPLKSLTFRVVDNAGTPVPGVSVGPWLIRKEGEGDSMNTSGASESFFDAITDSDGIAQVVSVPESMFMRTRFVAYNKGASDNKRWEEFDHENNQIPTFTLPCGTDGAAVVKGSVKLADGTPVAWTRISRKKHADCGHGLRFTDAKGEFELRESHGLLLDIGVESTLGALPGIFAFNVGDGSIEKRLDLVLEPGIKLHGHVFGPDGSPWEGYQIFMNEISPDPSPVADPDSCPTGGCPTGVVVRQTSDFMTTYTNGYYEYILPAAERTYDIRVMPLDDGENLRGEVKGFIVHGDEKEVTLDLKLDRL